MKNILKKSKDIKCFYCKSIDTYECGIKKGDYLCNKCGEHFNIYDRYIKPKYLTTEQLVNKMKQILHKK